MTLRLYILIPSLIVLLPIPINGYASTESSGEGEQTNIIENSDVLQACVTVLIGVLIFLTLERKFEKKDVRDLIIFMTRERDPLQIRFNDLVKDIGVKEKELAKIKKGDYRDYVEMVRDIENLRRDKNEVKARLDSTNATIENVKSLGKTDENMAAAYQKIKDREDIVNSIVVTLLSACVIFMIFVPSEWKYEIFDYTVLSRILFAAGIGVLVFRVFLYALDVK